MNILFYRYKSIFEPDCIDAFKYYGLQVDEVFSTDDSAKSLSKAADLILKSRKTNSPFLFVFSINFFPALSDLCQHLGIIYVCWSVDCPVNELLFNQIRNDCNRIFLFDYSQYERFERYNPGHIFYLPLGTNTARLDKTVSTISDIDCLSFSSDISFVGSLYNEKNPMHSVNLDDTSRGFIDGIMCAQRTLYGCNFIEKALTNDIISKIKGSEITTSNEGMVEPLDCYIAAHSYIGMQMAEDERRDTLNMLAREFKVDLYTLSDCKDLINVNNKGPANTLTEMPKIFNLSKINLNITMRPIQTGLSLRIFDVIGSGGFLITNYQAEIPNLFEIGTDLEVYTSPEELMDKCRYYLEHDDERKQIAQNGYNKVRSQHCVIHRIKEMLAMMTS